MERIFKFGLIIILFFLFLSPVSAQIFIGNGTSFIAGGTNTEYYFDKDFTFNSVALYSDSLCLEGGKKA